MKQTAQRLIAPVLLGLVGVLALWVSFLLTKTPVHWGAVNLNVTISLIGLVAGAYLVGLSGWMMAQRRGLLSLGDVVMAGGAVSLLLVTIQVSAYLGAILTIAASNALNN